MKKTHYPENVQTFLDTVASDAKKHDINIKLTKGRSVRLYPKGKAGGYFDECDIVVASNMPYQKWLPVFVHEACHMYQMIEGSRYLTPDLDDNIAKFDRYLSGTNVRNMEQVMDTIVMMEADCERRSMKKIIEYNLPINLDVYGKKANAYLLSHKALLHYRSWYKLSPSWSPYVWKYLPTTVSAPHTYRMKNIKVDPTYFKSSFNK